MGTAPNDGADATTRPGVLVGARDRRTLLRGAIGAGTTFLVPRSPSASSDPTTKLWRVLEQHLDDCLVWDRRGSDEPWPIHLVPDPGTLADALAWTRSPRALPLALKLAEVDPLFAISALEDLDVPDAEVALRELTDPSAWFGLAELDAQQAARDATAALHARATRLPPPPGRLSPDEAHALARRTVELGWSRFSPDGLPNEEPAVARFVLELADDPWLLSGAFDVLSIHADYGKVEAAERIFEGTEAAWVRALAAGYVIGARTK
ncbi:MAG: hypothetical protein HYV07_03935 [Deltaproteobacteria bacterium]|nr:hypothetical protein [Deltaproteobacteria bacterium]